MSVAINRAILLKTRTSPSESVDSGEAYFWLEGNSIKYKDDTQTIKTLATGVTPEEVQDIVGAFITSGNNKITAVYNDAGNTFVITLVESNIVHQNLSGVGTNTHAQIDSHLSNTSNPHGTTAAQVGADPTGTASAAISAHTAAADPHPQYLTLSEVLTSSPPPTSNLTAAASAGIATTAARADHVHAFSPSGVIAGSYGTSTTVPTMSVNAQGQVTSATNTDINFIQANSNILTGLSILDAAITAADTILSALGKLQGQINGLSSTLNWQGLKTTSNITNTSNTTGSSISSLGFSVVAGNTYIYEASIIYQTGATTTGIGVTLASPDGAAINGASVVNTPTTTDGTNSLYSGTINTLGDYVTSPGVQTANASFVLELKGSYIATVSGTINPTFRSEVNGSAVTVMAGSTATVRVV